MAKLYNYSGIWIIGSILWIIAFYNSPYSLDYKSHQEAGLWMYYRIYITGIETPLNYIENFNIGEITPFDLKCIL